MLINLEYHDDGEYFSQEFDLDYTTHAGIRFTQRLSNIFGSKKEALERLHFLLNQIPQYICEEVLVEEQIVLRDNLWNVAFVVIVKADYILIKTLIDEVHREIKMYKGQKFVEFSGDIVSYNTFDGGRKKC